MNSIEKKKQLRKRFLEIRSQISSSRRNESKKLLLSAILPAIEPFERVLSFYSFQSELETHELNHALFSIHKLSLPCIIDEKIVPFGIEKMDHFISYGAMMEPDPKFHKPCTIDLVLVPAIAFDTQNARLGWGKGHYDKFLVDTDYATIGIGFKEQLYEKALPIETHDISLEKVMLF